MKKTLLIAATFTAFGLTAGGSAMAQERGGDVTRAQVEARTAERFARMDANGDGLLNQADRESRARERFAASDANGDGALTFEEMQAARQEHRANRQERRAGRGEQARGERQGRRGHRMGRRGGARAMMQRADTNGDQAISLAEMTTAALARFDAADANGDGMLTAEERRAQRGQRRGRGGNRDRMQG